MPSERRNLRSSKEPSSSTDGKKARSNSQSSSAKDKPVPMRSTSSRSKASVAKKASSSGKEGSGSKPQTNGIEPLENGANGSEDVDMVDEGEEPVEMNGDVDEEMTVVVPPLKGSKLSGENGSDEQADTTMEISGHTEPAPEDAENIDPKVKAVTGMIKFLLVE
ncbi:MAG: hypothetical protein Q9184_008555 [Pyrenodesmia sp. 2 TL-2023]